jgi:hypothetical protein
MPLFQNFLKKESVKQSFAQPDNTVSEIQTPVPGGYQTQWEN